MSAKTIRSAVGGGRSARAALPATIVRANRQPPTAHLRRVAILAATLSLGACSWFTDFKRQPKIDPWESEADTVATRGNPQMSVPVTGTAVAGFQVSRTALPATIDSMSGLRNPTPISDASLANGRKYFQINCAVCHGDQGMGNGLATHYGMPGISIGANSPAANVRTDGYIFGMIRNGRGLMPTYDRIEEMDRWDVVNYLRALQGKVPNTAGVGPVGYPGQTGTALPGFTQTGPTRPSPFLKPSRLGSAEASAGAGASSGAMETGRGTSTMPGGAADTAAGAAARPTTDTAAARKKGGAQ